MSRNFRENDTFGDNSSGQLGLGHTNACTALTPVTQPSERIQQVVAGGTHTLVLTDQGLYVCGNNDFGQLGSGHTNACTTFTPVAKPLGTIQQVAAGSFHTLVLTDQGLYACGGNYHGQLGLGHQENCATLTALPNLPAELRQLQALYHQFSKLITLSESKPAVSQPAEFLDPSNNNFSSR